MGDAKRSNMGSNKFMYITPTAVTAQHQSVDPMHACTHTRVPQLNLISNSITTIKFSQNLKTFVQNEP